MRITRPQGARSSRGRQFAVACVFACAWGVLATPRVEAGCTHAVDIRPPGAAERSFFDPLLLIADSSRPHAASELPETPPKSPCKGFLCSGSPIEPLAPTTIEPPHPSKWAVRAAPDADDANPRARLSNPRERVATIHRPASIFHPLRAAAA
ncbi:MAG: hypothetical protein KGM43_02885 [Planctomycetota bacterium]|nr:hypothetical protein [Planctomycetota bacterium]